MSVENHIKYHKLCFLMLFCIESPEKPKKQRTMPRQPSLPETKLPQQPNVSMQLGIGSTPNMQVSQVLSMYLINNNFKQN